MQGFWKGVAQKPLQNAQTAASGARDIMTALTIKPEDPQLSDREQAEDQPDAVSASRGPKRPAKDSLETQAPPEKPRLYTPAKLQCNDSPVAFLQPGNDSIKTVFTTQVLALDAPIHESLVRRTAQKQNLKESPLSRRTVPTLRVKAEQYFLSKTLPPKKNANRSRSDQHDVIRRWSGSDEVPGRPKKYCEEADRPLEIPRRLRKGPGTVGDGFELENTGLKRIEGVWLG